MEFRNQRALFGELFRFSFDTLKNNWQAFLLVALFAMVPGLVMLVGGGTTVLANLSALQMMGGNPDPMTILPMVGAFVTSAFAAMVAMIIVGPVITASNFHIAKQSSVGEFVGAGDAIKFGFSKWGQVFLAGLLLALLSLVPVFIILLLVVVTVFIASAAGTAGGVLFGIITAVATVLISIVYGVKVCFVMPIVCTENLGFGEALRKSMDVSNNGEFWDVLLKLILMMMAVIGISMVAQFTIGLIPVVGAIVSLVVSAVTDILFNNYILAYYLDRNQMLFGEEVPPVSF